MIKFDTFRNFQGITVKIRKVGKQGTPVKANGRLNLTDFAKFQIVDFHHPARRGIQDALEAGIG